MFAHVGDVNGNRFLLLDLRAAQHISVESLGEISAKLCESEYIDDLLVIEHSDVADARLQIIGGDKREADFCGDGFLIVLHLLFAERDASDSPTTRLAIETRHGVKYGVRSETGEIAGEVGTITNGDAQITASARRQIEALGVAVEGFRIAGEPHLVVSAPPGSALPGRDKRQLEDLARKLVPCVPFEGGINVTMILDREPERARICTFERGVQRITRACGSGAIAAASVLFERDPSQTVRTIVSPGGRHCVSSDSEGQRWWLSAETLRIEAQQQFDIDVPDPERDTERLLNFVRR